MSSIEQRKYFRPITNLDQMYFKYFPAALLAGLLIVTMGCKHDHPHNPDGSHPTDSGHAHGPDGSHISHAAPSPATLIYTEMTDDIELFVEFSPFILGTDNALAVHYTHLSNIKPVTSGVANLRLLKNGKSIQSVEQDSPSSPGIFNMMITPSEVGNHALEFVLKTKDKIATFTISDIVVYKDEAAALSAHPQTEGDDGISFLKEQAWKTDFAIEKVERRTIHDVIRTSGEIHPIKSDEKIVSAKNDGLVFYKNSKLQQGREIKKGEVLFSLSSKGLLESNIEKKVRIAKARWDEARSNFERAGELVQQQIIGQKEYENRKMEYGVAKAEWEALSSNNIGEVSTISSPMSGIIKNLLVSDGSYVSEGDALIEITNTSRLVLEAEVAQNYRHKLPKIATAHFKAPHQTEMQTLEDYNGKLISVGKTLNHETHFLPVWFEIDNVNDIVPGSYVELFLLTEPIKNQLTISKSALLKDYNVDYVYVQKSGEGYEKREVRLGIDDGKKVQILSGIEEGEWVVTRGAYQIKMASMSSAIPSHGHSH